MRGTGGRYAFQSATMRLARACASENRGPLVPRPACCSRRVAFSALMRLTKASRDSGDTSCWQTPTAREASFT